MCLDLLVSNAFMMIRVSGVVAESACPLSDSTMNLCGPLDSLIMNSRNDVRAMSLSWSEMSESNVWLLAGGLINIRCSSSSLLSWSGGIQAPVT